MKQLLQLFRRGKAWKEYVQSGLNTHEAQIAALKAELLALKEARIADAAQIAELKTSLETELERQFAFRLLLAKQFLGSVEQRLPEIAQEGDVLLLAQRGSEVLLLPISATDAAAKRLAGTAPWRVVEAIVSGTIESATLLSRTPLRFTGSPLPAFLDLVREDALQAIAWLEARQPKRLAPAAYFERLDDILAEPDLIDFFAHGSISAGQPAPVPFDTPDLLSQCVAAEPKRRSVLFLQHCYYNFYYLAQSLRKRGWDAVVLSTEGPSSSNRAYYHGEDITIYDNDPVAQNEDLLKFYNNELHKYGIIHTYGVGILSFFPSHYDTNMIHGNIPWDMIERKRAGTLLGYSHSGCLDGVSQSAFRTWSPTMCGNCVWEDRPDVCSDTKNLAWGRKVTSIVDLFCTETDPSIDYKAAKNVFRAPLTFAIDPQIWHPEIAIPDTYRRQREKGEIVVYHAMGNHSSRSREGRNVKGTNAVIDAVTSLQKEGISIRLDFVTNVPSKDNRFVQAQADIIVDQLNYGRYGALAREGMMLGKPVVGRVNKMDGPNLPATQCILDTPIVHADEQTIKNVLRDLALNPQKRQEIGIRSREHATYWWSAERLAARFEQVYDHVREHGVPPAEEDVP